jgi:hypothetical protein
LAFRQRACARLIDGSEIVASPNAPQAPIAKAPAARAVLTATTITVAVASNSVAATSARIVGVKLSVIALLLPKHVLR